MKIDVLKTTPDPTLKDFYADKERLADLVNGLCFQGIENIKAENIKSESNEVSTLFEDNNAVYSFNAYRDVLVKICDQGYLILIGIENQQNIDLYIPLREFLYAAFTYNKQYRDYQKECRQRSQLGLSQKKFRLIPVITPVIYYGENEWKENHYISDLMRDVPKEWEPYINDWYTRVIDVKHVNTSVFKNKDNKDLFDGLIKIYKSKGCLENLSEMRVSKDVAILLATITGMKGLAAMIMEEESEEIDMCRSWDIYVERMTNEKVNKSLQQGIERGLQQGIERGLKQGLEQGLQQGLEQGMSQGLELGISQGKTSVIISLLSQKLGDLSHNILSDIKSSSLDKIDLLTINLFNIQSEQDILNIIH